MEMSPRCTENVKKMSFRTGVGGSTPGLEGPGSVCSATLIETPREEDGLPSVAQASLPVILPSHRCGPYTRQDELEAYLPLRIPSRTVRSLGISEAGDHRDCRTPKFERRTGSGAVKDPCM